MIVTDLQCSLTENGDRLDHFGVQAQLSEGLSHPVDRCGFPSATSRFLPSIALAVVV